MPATLVDRLPLPNLKVYSAGSVMLLSVAMYHAIGVTSAPEWRLNATLREAAAQGGEQSRVQPAGALATANGTRDLAEQLADVMTYMMQEPLCMWTVINVAYCSLALAGLALQRLVFGPLRVAEAQRVKDKFWNYVFYKFIFVFGVLNVQYMDEVLLWCAWFTLLGALLLLGQLCKDRFEYLSSSPAATQWAHARLGALVGAIACASAALLATAARVGLPAGRDTFAFMAAECVLVLLGALHIVARYALQARDADAAGPLAYYTHLVFDAVSLAVELCHVVHMVVFSRLVVSMPSLVLLLQLRHTLHRLQARLRRHRLYTALAHHMSHNYPMASKEEVAKNQDNCAICWEPMKEARKLPCSHLFHNSCLCQWVQQDASCPTCRRALHAPAPAAAPRARAAALDVTLPLPLPLAARPNHLFHFDGSRYVSWLPSFSVEVTRVRGVPLRTPAPDALRLEAMLAQVHQMFPHFPRAQLAADLALTRSPDLTADNILEGRLLPPSPSPPTAEAATEMESAAAAALHRPASPPASPPADPPAPHGGHPARPAHALLDDLIAPADEPEPSFSALAGEREGLLRRRQEQLRAAARQRYLQRLARAPQGS